MTGYERAAVDGLAQAGLGASALEQHGAMGVAVAGYEAVHALTSFDMTSAAVRSIT